MPTIAPHSTSPPFLEAERETAATPHGGGTSIVLIDHRPLPRQCLSRWLQDGAPDLRVISVGSSADLLDASRPVSEPHMIVFSVGAASLKEPEVRGKIKLLRREMSHIPIVLLSDRDDVEEIVDALELGARGYIPTSLEVSEAAAAIHCVEAGCTFVPASALIRSVQDRQTGSSQGLSVLEVTQFQRLTPRELDVLAHLRQGKPNKVIAYELDISESTVKVFVRRILTKLRASNRTEVAARRQIYTGNVCDDHASPAVLAPAENEA